MAILVMDGFDGFVDSADFRAASEGMCSGSTSPILYSPTGGRYGDGALNLNANSSCYYSRTFPPQATGQKIYAGFSYRGTISGSGTTFATVFQFCASGAGVRVIGLQINPQGAVRIVENNAAVNDSATGVIPNNTWCWIEVEVTLGSTGTNGSFDVRVNGASVLSLPVSAGTVDTFVSTSALCASIRFYGSSAQAALIDDLVVWNNQGTAPTSWIGDSRISSYVPNADGSVMAWTPTSGSGFSNIDDPLASADADATYIEASTAATKARFGMGDISGTTTTVHAVALKARVRKTKVAVKTMRGYARSVATEANGTTIGLTDAYKVRTLGMFDRNPNGSVAWTDSSVNSAEFGVEVVS